MATPSLMLTQVTCSVCKKTFSDPLQLPCQHTFCSSCVTTSAQDGKDEKDSGETLTCAQCGESCRRDECVVDTKTLELMELYNSCTSDRKQGGGKLKLHLPSRLLGSKKDKKHDTKQEVSEGKKPLNGSASILRPGDHASVCSVVDEDTVLCEICMKHGTKWMCLKCTHKTCDFCRKNDMLLCKDQTREHIFVEFETTSSSSDHGEDGSQPVPQSYRRTAESLALKKVTFEGIEDLTESSTDSDLPRPNYRDSLALTKDKKQRLQDILKELQEMERVGQSRCEALSSYHDYMTDVKVAGFDLLGQAEMLLHDRVKEFFVKMRQDYEQGFNEMTSATEDIHDKMNSNLQSIQMNAAILEEIVENNDTRVMMDQEFLDGKCDEVEKSVVELAQTIVQCNSAGLRKSTTEWGTEEKSEFEKTMNCNILQAVEEEMEKSLYCEMREGVQKMRPEVDTVKPVKRVSRLMPHKDSKRKWYDCVIS